MAEGSPQLRQLDFGRLASLRILIATALIFRDKGLPGKDEHAARQQDAFLGLIEAGALTAQSETVEPLGAAIRRALRGSYSFEFSGQTPAALILSKRIGDFRLSIDNFECPHYFNRNGESNCLGEFLELLSRLHSFAATAYRKVTDGETISWPKIFLETAHYHAHQTTDILDIAAATGTCRYADAPQPISIV